MHAAHTRTPAAGSVGVTAKSSPASSGGIVGRWDGWLEVSMYEILMNQYLGDMENVLLEG